MNIKKRPKAITLIILTFLLYIALLPTQAKSQDEAANSNATATAIKATVIAELSATPKPTRPSTSESIATDVPNFDATATALFEQVEAVVAATLAVAVEAAVKETLTVQARPTQTPKPTATPIPPKETLSAAQMTAVSNAATAEAYLSRPTRTPIPTSTQTPTVTPTPTVDATATANAQIVERIQLAQSVGRDPEDVMVNPVDGAVYLRVPEGAFVMGGDDGPSSEQPAHTVYLDEFWIMRTEVTNAQYKRCVEAKACSKPNNDSWDDTKLADHPVTHVNWEQVSDYAEWVGGRLPTEAEWEKAACGDDGRLYPWGNQEPTEHLANYGSNVKTTTSVGRYPKGMSPYGVLDMAGNVREWAADWYDSGYYKSSPKQNPVGPLDGTTRVLRSGAFNLSQNFVRCSARYNLSPFRQSLSTGFRVMTPSF